MVNTTMERRKFVIGLGSLAAGGAAAAGTGAFTSVEADRNVEVDVEGDAQAYLRLTGDEEFIEDEEPDAGALKLHFGVNESTDEGGEGFNKDAVTLVEDIVEIENQGTEDAVTVEFGEGGDDGFKTTLSVDDADVTLMIEDNNSIDPGEKTTIDAEVDTIASGGDDDEVTIYAEAAE